MIQLIKLKNNLDIITEIRSKNEKSIVLHRPFVVQNMSIPSPMGVRVVQVIRPWIENTNENNVTLPSDAVLLSVSPDIELVRKYQFALHATTGNQEEYDKLKTILDKLYPLAYPST